MIKNITKKEWKFLIIMSLVIIILTSLPYVYGYLNTPKGFVYTGIHGMGMGDNHVFYSYIEQVKNGDLVFKDLFTSEKQDRIILNVFWLFAGLFAKIFNLSTLFAFHLLRVLLIPVFIFVLYLFTSLIFQNKIKRFISSIILLFSSGLGAFGVPFIDAFYSKNINLGQQYNWPMDLWVPEGYTFLTFYHSPHFIASAILLILIFLFSFLAIQKNSIKYSVIAGLISLLLFQFHPFHVPTVFSCLAFYVLIKSVKEKRLLVWKYIRHLLIIVFISLPSILYYLILMRYDVITMERALQNTCLTPKWWIVIISYGLLFFCALGTLYIFSKKKIKLREIDLFLIIWFVVQFGLIFSPLNWQRRLAEGLQFPMVMLGAIFLFYIYEHYKNNKRWKFLLSNNILLMFLFILFFAPTSFLNVIRDISYYNFNIEQERQIFYAKEERIWAMKWLQENIPKDSVIFSSALSGNFIPGISARTVFIGHGVETVSYEEKLKNVVWFFRKNKNDGRHHQFLKRENIDYIFYSDFEKVLGRWSPKDKDYLEKVYENDGVEIYRVR